MDKRSEVYEALGKVFFKSYSPSLFLGSTKKEETVSENEKFIRIKVSNVRFNDSCEQMKFNQMLIDCPDKAIDQIESLLEQRVLEISFD